MPHADDMTTTSHAMLLSSISITSLPRFLLHLTGMQDLFTSTSMRKTLLYSEKSSLLMVL